MVDDRRVLFIRKPHGCVQALVEADALLDTDPERAAEIASRFMITWKELRTTRPDVLDQRFFTSMTAQLQTGSLLVAGWSVSEPYIQDVIKKSLSTLRGPGPGKIGDLSVIDLEFNAEGHMELSSCYKLKREDVFFQVTKVDEGFDIDQLFLWLQGLYCISQLQKNSSEETKAKLEVIAATLADPNSKSFVTDWADRFLPAWTRLCWRGEVIDCPGFQANQIELDKRDVQIPWRLPTGTVRHDLVSAARLLVALSENGLNLAARSGGLWDKSKRRLIIPIPAWKRPNSLASLKPLLTEMRADLPFVETIEILPLHPTATVETIDPELVDLLISDLQNVMSSARFAQPGNIKVAGDLNV